MRRSRQVRGAIWVDKVKVAENVRYILKFTPDPRGNAGRLTGQVFESPGVSLPRGECFLELEDGQGLPCYLDWRDGGLHIIPRAGDFLPAGDWGEYQP